MTCRPPVDTITRGESATKQDWKRPRVLTPDEIIKIVAIETEVPPDAILGNNRRKELVEARHLAMYFVRDKTTLSVSRIGRIFHRDHTTTLHALKMVRSHYETEKPYRIKYHAIEWLLNKASRI